MQRSAAHPRVPYLRFGPPPGARELWVCRYAALPNVVYYSGSDDSHPDIGYFCSRVTTPPSLGNSGLLRLVRLLAKFTDGIPIE